MHVEITKVPYCAIDFETTQIIGKPGELAIIEIGAQRFTWNGLQGIPYESLVNPRCKIRPFDTGVSGISDRMVCDKPSFIDVFPDFSSYIRGRVIVAHNAPFDQKALKSQCQRDNLTEPENMFIDSAALLRKTRTLSKYGLEDAAQYFNLSKRPVHRALGDSLIVVDLFVELLKILYSECGIRTFGQLCALTGMTITSKSEQISLF